MPDQGEYSVQRRMPQGENGGDLSMCTATSAGINGLEIEYEIQGDGPPIVFVHGLGATSNVWHAQRTTLSKYYRVIVYDRSGSGRSQKARTGYSIEGWADELAGLLECLAVPAAVVV